VQVGANQFLQFGRISLDPAKDGYVVHLNAAVQQHEFEIAVTDGKHQIPPDRPKDHLGTELPPLEGLILPHLHRLSLTAKSCNRASGRDGA
jgi:hypothetical protein